MDDKVPLHVISSEVGAAFALGAAGSFGWNFLKGLGYYQGSRRLLHSFRFAQGSSSATGANFALWAVAFGACSHFMRPYVRNDNRFGPYIAGCVAAGLYETRSGFKKSVKQALLGGTMLTSLENVVTLATKKPTPTPRELFYQEVSSLVKEIEVDSKRVSP